MTKSRLLVAGAAAAGAAAALALGIVHREPAAAVPPERATARLTAVQQQQQQDPTAGDTARLVRRLEAQVRAAPTSDGYARLGLAYQQRARETGDPAYYPLSERALRLALELSPKDLTATSGLAALALSRHRFRDALVLGRRAVALSRATAHAHGIVGDALLELGRYGEAFREFDTMARLRPDLASYARISYARELLGNIRGAIETMELALDAASGEAEPQAWTHVQLGKIFWSQGLIARSEREDRAALAALPGYVYALDALAQAEAARGLLSRAIAHERAATDAIPLPQFVGSLGDMYRAAGRVDEARKQYALVSVIRRLLVANGVKADLETSLFDVDHGVRLRQALSLARSARAERPSIDGDDVLAWALARNGRCGEALHFSKLALRLGTIDASKFFHRGMIERCLGHRAGARTWFRRALDLNPHFSLLWAPIARRYGS